jgi:protease IV
MTLFEMLKTIFFLTIFAYIAPSLFDNIKKKYIPLLEPRTYIGIIHIQDALQDSYEITEQLHNFFKNTQIKAIIIKMNCSHGHTGTSQTIFHEIKNLKKEYPKPIITLVENYCMAQGYLIASACDYIIAPESSLIGNINASRLISEKATSSHISTTTLPEIEHDVYQQFTKQIAMARKLSLATTANWAEGKICTAHQAIGLGLIDEIGSLCTVIKIITQKALIDGEIEWIEHKKNYLFPLENIFSMSSLATKTQ